MLDYDQFDEDDDNNHQSEDESSEPFKKLRSENRKLKEQVKTLPDMQRKLAAFELGLDPKQATVKLFLNQRDLDFSDMESVRKAAEEYELIQPEGSSTSEEQAAEAAAQGRVAGAGAAGAAPDSGGAVTDFSQAKSEAEVIALVQAQGGEVWFD